MLLLKHDLGQRPYVKVISCEFPKYTRFIIKTNVDAFEMFCLAVIANVDVSDNDVWTILSRNVFQFVSMYGLS